MKSSNGEDENTTHENDEEYANLINGFLNDFHIFANALVDPQLEQLL